MRIQIVIPARLASTRLPEKLLLRAGGKSVLQHTYERALGARCACGVIVAVDHPRLAEEVTRFGGHAIMTDPQHPSGTDRIAEVARAVPEVDIWVNVQGDEPRIDPSAIDLVATLLSDNPLASIATAGTPIRDPERLADPSCVKIVLGQGNRALYFSRAAVPHVREGLSTAVLHGEPPHFWHHLGLYAYRREFLNWFAAEPPSPLEQLEKLEQLRALEAGKTILVGRVASAPRGIDTAEDFASFEAFLASSSEGPGSTA